jgi:pilus assembly protein Flp/PilA
MIGKPQFLASLIRDRRGATVVEYGFIISCIILAIMLSLIQLGATTGTMWNNVSTKVKSAAGG